MTLEASIDELGRTALRLKRERDALLAAARMVVNACMGCSGRGGRRAPDYENCDDVLAHEHLRTAIEQATA